MSCFNNLKLTRVPIVACDKEIVTIYEKPEVIYPDGEVKADAPFYVVNRVAIKDRVDRQKYINSFAKDVGIMNIAKKLALSGENIFDGRFAVKGNSFFDATILPQDGEQLNKMMASKQKIWNSLDPELKKGMTYEQFVESFDQKAFVEYLNSKVAAKAKTTDPAEPTGKEGE